MSKTTITKIGRILPYTAALRKYKFVKWEVNFTEILTEKVDKN